MTKLVKFRLAESLRLLAVHLQGLDAALKQLREVIEEILSKS